MSPADASASVRSPCTHWLLSRSLPPCVRQALEGQGSSPGAPNDLTNCSSGSASGRASSSLADTCSSAAYAASPAYSTFAGVTKWEQVTDMDGAAKAHLKAANVTPAVARALTEELGECEGGAGYGVGEGRV